jgi:uncharacterized protein
MFIEVGKVPEGERIWDMQASFAEGFLSGIKFPINVKTKRERSKISCFAKYKTEITCECSRCLQEFQYEIKGEVYFFVAYENETCSDNEFDFYFYKSGNDKINFAQTIYDDIVTQIPMKPLCRENCEGIELIK